MEKKVYLGVFLAVISVASLTLFNLQISQKINLSSKLVFEEWKASFGKNYKSEAENVYRFGIFQKNLIMVNQHNRLYQKGQAHSQLRLNQFSDLTIEEFKKMYLSEQKTIKSESQFECSGPQYPKKTTFNDSFIVNKDMLLPVGTQGQCASGYAFATVSGVEASMYKATYQAQPLSVQQLIDCSQRTGNSGCNGGTSVNALHEFMNRGAMRSIDYPFSGIVGSCKYSEGENSWVWRVDDCTKASGDLALLKSQILEQPVIVGFDASDATFIQYGSGLYIPKNCRTDKINHYMLAVGWGVTTTGNIIKTTNYYIIVKNSFGVQWGSSGYANVVVQSNNKQTGGCGMTNSVYFPLS